MLSSDVLGEESLARNLQREDLEYLFGVGDKEAEES
jgi:hypothetical protein